MAVKFQLRRDTAANWTANNPILSQGEPGVETDTLKFKLGDGITAWSLLDYASSNFADLTNTPTTLAGYGITDAATSAQGSLADTAVQPGDLAAIATSGSYNDLGNTPTTLAGYGITDAATSAQGSLADSAVQPNDNISVLVNDAGYLTTVAFGDLTSTPTTIAGYGITDAFDGAYSSLTGAPTNVSSFTNDSGYLTSSVFASAVPITATTASTSTTTGALTVAGGVGIVGDLYLGSTLNSAQGITAPSLTSATSTLNLRSTNEINLQNSSSQTVVKINGGGDGVHILRGGLELDDSAGASSGRITFRNSSGQLGYIELLGDWNIDSNLASNGISFRFGSSGWDKNFQMDARYGNFAVLGITESNQVVGSPIPGVVEFSHPGKSIQRFPGTLGLDWDLEFTNFYEPNPQDFNDLGPYSYSVVVIVEQGATPYIPTGNVGINGNPGSIVWQGGSAPAGTANGIDVFSFTVLADWVQPGNSPTWTVLGSATSYS